MPLFGYTCMSCGAQQELLVRTDEKVICPTCGSSKMERQLSRFAPVMAASPEPACSGCSMGNEACCAARDHRGCMG